METAMEIQESPEIFEITGVVVHVRPDRCDALVGEINALPGTEVHGVSEQGKLVVIVEELNGEKLALRTIEKINDMSGVLSTSLVYQHREAPAH